MKKRIIAACMASAVCLGAASAAQNYKQSITVEYGLGLEINGANAVLKDPNGNSVKPMVYNGTTYVPIRAVSDTLGCDVQYDAELNEAYIYNDLVEIMAAAYMLENAIENMDYVQQCAFENVVGGYSNVFGSVITTCTNEIANNQSMIALLQDDNIKFDLLTDPNGNGESILDLYNECVKNYNKIVAYYQDISSGRSSSQTLQNFKIACGTMTLDAAMLKTGVSNLINDATWRSLK